MKFGLIVYRETDNIGDDILSYAAEQYLPSTDYIIDRENMDIFCPEESEQVTAVLNGWYLHHKNHWPPSSYLRLLPIGIHFAQKDNFSIDYEYLEGYGIEVLTKAGPVGCRDSSTREALEKKGLEAYFSGCLTLTLQRFPNVVRTEDIYGVDLPGPVYDYLKDRLGEGLKKITHYVEDSGSLSWQERRVRVERFLVKYQSAKCVITTRLHAALPCLALGTPVLLLYDPSHGDRFADYLPLLHYCTLEDFRNGRCEYDYENPPPNKENYQTIRKELSQRCRLFMQETGADVLPGHMEARKYSEYKQKRRTEAARKENRCIRETEELRSWSREQQESIAWLKRDKEQLEDRTKQLEERIRELEAWSRERTEAVDYLEGRLREKEEELQRLHAMPGVRLALKLSHVKGSFARREAAQEISYRKLSLADKQWIDPIVKADGGAEGHKHFNAMFLCQDMYDDFFAEFMGCVIKQPEVRKNHVYCQYPIGERSKRKEAAKQLYGKYARKGMAFTFFAVSEEGLEELKALWQEKNLSIESDRNNQCYIFSVEEQTRLQGAKFQDRRNKLRRFDKRWDWEYEELTEDNLQECMELNDMWVRKRGMENGIGNEQKAFQAAMENFTVLGLEGAILRVNGKTAAFCIGEPLNETYYLLHFQKADNEVQDVVIKLLQEFYTRRCGSYKYINYSEDAGIEGLRKFKMMMHPVFFTAFYNVGVMQEGHSL